MTLVFDSGALVCWLRDEAGADKAAQLLASPDEPLLIHAANFAEFRYVLARLGPRAAADGLARMAGTRLTVSRQLDDRLLDLVVHLKLNYTPIALGDTFAVALAAVRDATLVTTDRAELQKLADAGICRIEFLR